MNHTKQLLLYVLLSINSALVSSQKPVAVENGYTTPQERIKNIIILNDVNVETFWLQKKECPDDFATEYLQRALLQKQIVICTKSLWRNSHFRAHIWSDFSTMDTSSLLKKYSFI